jgi:molybdate transport system substrate-binding protein
MNVKRRHLIRGLPSLILAVVGAMCASAGVACERRGPSAGQAQITVFAAASTVDVMREAGSRFEKEHGVKVSFSFDASSNLARQIKAGAPGGCVPVGG